MENKLSVMEPITIQGIRGKTDENGTVWLNLEDVARGLGFARIAASGNEVVRWATVREYLQEYNVPTSWHGDSQPVGKEGMPEYIPESVFYRLAMKANNEAAKRFQAIVAEEILPAIRKHGMYATPQKIEEMLLDPDTMILTLQELKKERQARVAAELQLELDKPYTETARAIAASSRCYNMEEFAKLIQQEHGLNLGGRNKIIALLREMGFLLQNNSTMYQKYNKYFKFTTKMLPNNQIVTTTLVKPAGIVYLIPRILDYVRRNKECLI